MNIDFIEASKFVSKDNPDFGFLQRMATYEGGFTKYALQGCRELNILYNPNNGILLLRGSIMYFIQGHNFTYSKESFVQAINYIGGLIKENLWDMVLNILEVGVIVKVDKLPKVYIQHHREGKRQTMYEDPKNKGTFRSFNDKYADRKMYDAGRNIKHKQGTSMKKVIEESGWNPADNYLKWEVHYKKPEWSLNGGRGILLSDLVKPDWEDLFKEDIYSQYKTLIPMTSIITPKEKSKLSTPDLLAIQLAESQLNEGKTLAEIKKVLRDRINATDCLSKSDKDARKRQINTIFKRLQMSDISAYDLSAKLQEALFPETDEDLGNPL